MSGDRLPTILLYHQIEEVPSERTSVTPATFRAQLLSLREEGWEFVPLAELLSILTSGASGRSGLPRLAVTFDDGYADLLGAAGFLADHNIPATVFLITGAVGSNNLWNPRAHTVARHLSLAEIASLAAGVDFQLHGTDHQRLTKFDRAELEDRFRDGCAWFETALGCRPSTIAYPYGSFNDTVRQTAGRFFTHGLSVSQGGWGGESSRYALNRVEIESWMSAEFLAHLLSAERRQRGRLLAEARTAGRCAR